MSFKAGLCFLGYRAFIMPVQLNLCSRNCRSLKVSVVNCRHNNKRPPDLNKSMKNKFDNPGMSRRLKIIKQDTPDIDSVDVCEEDIEDLEADFLNARQMKEYHIREAEKIKHRNELKMTERKHFKRGVEPNMLTWSDKEQIRYLHKEDPKSWTFDRLSESFPATPQIIKKIIKSYRKPESNARVRKHDEVVASNWKAFNEDKLNINCPHLKEHLEKFSKRVIVPFTSDNSVTSETLPKPAGSEFVGIIQSYKPTNISEESNDSGSKVKGGYSESNTAVECNDDSKESNMHALIKRDLNKHEFNDIPTNSPPVYVDNKSDYTLETLRDKIREKQTRTDLKHLNEQDKMLLKGGASFESVSVVKQLDTPETVSINSLSNFYSNNDNADVPVDKQVMTVTPSKAVTDFKPMANDVGSFVGTNIPKRIHIPKSKVNVGYLYKVNDCFYSHDGFFLYKVPGIVNENI